MRAKGTALAARFRRGGFVNAKALKGGVGERGLSARLSSRLIFAVVSWEVKRCLPLG
jgi:hypothetical protein